MASSINASLTAGLVQTADTSGIINLQSGGTTVATISSTGLATTGGALNGSLGATTPSTVVATTITGSLDATISGLTVGKGAGSVTTNTAVGVSALAANTTGSANTALGFQAGYSNTTGLYGTFIGWKAGYGSTGDENTFIGSQSGTGNTGTFNTFIGDTSGYLVTTGSKNTIIGRYSGLQGGLDIRTASNYIVLSDGDGNPRIWHSGSFLACPTVYSVTTANTPNVFVDSAGGIYRGGVSALKYKQDIRDIELIDINKFRPVRYKSKCEMDDQTKDHFGIIADEVDEAGITELVTYGTDGEVEGFQYERLTVVLLKTIQDLQALITALTARLDEQQAQISVLQGAK